MNVWLSNYANNHPGRSSLFVGLLGGMANVAVDIDHIWAPRAWHTPLLVGAGIIAIYCLACLGRLFYRVVLRR